MQLPPNTKLMLLKGFEREEVVDLYRKAKVFIDTFLTGNERGVYEATLLNAVPIISNHGPGQSWHDFPLHQASARGSRGLIFEGIKGGGGGD
jgi:hypothetical protein